MSQIQGGKWASTQATLDYKADSWTTSLTLGNPDIVNGSGVGVLHYLKSITPKVALGAELAYQAMPQLPGGHIAVASMASRIAFDQDCNALKQEQQSRSRHWIPVNYPTYTC